MTEKDPLLSFRIDSPKNCSFNLWLTDWPWISLLGIIRLFFGKSCREVTHTTKQEERSKLLFFKRADVDEQERTAGWKSPKKEKRNDGEDGDDDENVALKRLTKMKEKRKNVKSSRDMHWFSLYSDCSVGRERKSENLWLKRSSLPLPSFVSFLFLSRSFVRGTKHRFPEKRKSTIWSVSSPLYANVGHTTSAFPLSFPHCRPRALLTLFLLSLSPLKRTEKRENEKEDEVLWMGLLERTTEQKGKKETHALTGRKERISLEMRVNRTTTIGKN